jgi:hypothetical protein
LNGLGIESGDVPVMEFIDKILLYNFDFGRIQSSVMNSGYKWIQR